MAAIFNQAQKDNMAALIDRVHETFAKDILVITERANAVIEENGEYNAFSDRRDTAITYTAESQTITARIKFLDKPEDYSELIFAGGGGGQVGGTAVPLSLKFGVIRLKIDKQYESLVANSSKIIVNGEDCQFIMNYVPQSLFDTNYSLCYVNRQK